MTETQTQNPGIVSDGDGKSIRLAHIMYALHAFSAISGVLSSATIVGAFVFGWPSIIAVVMNYFTRSGVSGTWLDSHWRWQLRTFWFAAIWIVIAFVTAITIVGLVIAIPVVVFTGLWLLYRVVRGWMALRDRIAMPVD
jgi:uncharacterized membrane protein